MTYRYTVVLERGASEDVWVATVPALAGCITQGGSIEEALARAQEAATGYVETLAELGEPVPTESDPAIVTTVLVDIESTPTPPLVGAAD